MGLQLMVFAKAPEPGKAKTRLIPALGVDGTARLAAQLLQQTLDAAYDAATALGQTLRGPVHLHVCGSPHPAHRSWSGIKLPQPCLCSAQINGDLGARMAHAFTQALVRGDDALLFGTDGIGLDCQRIVQAAQALAQHDAVLQPVQDGGYLLLGLRATLLGKHTALFEAMPWSTDQVAALTLARLGRLGCTTRVLPALRDIDTPEDLAHMAKKSPASP